MKPRLSLLVSLGCCTLAQGIYLKPTSSQVTPDGTTSTTVDADSNDFTITDGDRAGGNLFHSFDNFSFPTDGSAFFDNNADIANIFSRVTGGNISNIDGLIRTNDASLFLINPAGIIFGSGARLDLGGGSFYGSTADSILFPDDISYSASDLNPPLLTINAPIGLSFRDNPEPIINQSLANDLGLAVAEGSNISLIGGNVNLESGLISAPGGTVNLGGLSESGTITISEDGSLSFPEGITRSDLSLNTNASVDVGAGGGGFININARNLELDRESLILAGIKEGLGSENAIAGTINIDANSIFADNNSQIRSETEGIGNAGIINVKTDNLNFVDGSAIVVSTFGQGDAGTVNLNAKNIAFDREWSGIYSTVGLRRLELVEQATEAIGNGGTINVNTDTLSLTNGARILGNTIAQGNAANINIDAAGEVSYIGQGDTFIPAFDGPVISGSFSQVREGASGSGGQITIEAGSLTLIDKGAVLVDNRGGQGDAGDITIDVRDKIFADQIALILSQVAEDAEGNGGDINIAAGSFEATGGTFILADTKGEGNAGNINIDVERTFSLDEGTAILTEVQDEAQGNGGDINISANSVIIKNGSRTNSLTKGQGNAGNINITANKSVILENDGAILSQTTDNALGNGGNISITTNFGEVISNSSLSTSTQSQGDAGDLTLTINNLTVSDEAEIKTDASALGAAGQLTIVANTLDIDRGQLNATTAAGEGGNIKLDVDDTITLNSDSLISTAAIGNANGGNIDIDTNFIIATPNQNNDIIASAETGMGGRITIDAESIFGLQVRPQNDLTNDIDASGGVEGEIIINTPDVDITKGLVEVPQNVVEPEQTVAQVCEADRENVARNGLTIKGKGGIPPQPTSPLDSDIVITQQQNPRAYYPDIKPIKTSIGDITLARGIVKTESGEIILTAYPTDGIDRRPPSIKANCT